MPKITRTPAYTPAHAGAYAAARARKYIRVYITDDLRDALDITAEAWGCSMSDVVRQVLRGALLKRAP